MTYRKERIEALRKAYPAGCRVMLDRMDDPQAPPMGTFGTVCGVDDAAQIMVNWDTGGSLSVIDGKDLCHRIDPNPNHKEVADKLHTFCEEVHYRQSPAIIGHWQPGLRSETARMFTTPGGMNRIIKGVLRFAKSSAVEDSRKAEDVLLVLAEHYKAVRPNIGMAMALIDDFCQREYKDSDGADYTDLSMVSLAFTTSNGSVAVEVFVDLLDYRLLTYVNGEEIEVLCYESLEKLIETELRFLDFEGLVDIGRWEALVCS